jgi:magnesium transporter
MTGQGKSNGAIVARIAYHDGVRVPDATGPGIDDGHSCDLLWVALENPSRQDMVGVTAEFGLPDFAVGEAVRAHQRPKVERHGQIVSVVLKPVHYVDSHEVVEVTEITLFLGPQFVVTVRHGETDVLRRVIEDLDDPAPAPEGPFDVLARVATLVVEGYETALDGLNVDVDEIEEAVFVPGEADHSERIYKLKREVSEFRRAVAPLVRVLERLADDLCPDPALTEQFRGSHDHLMRVADLLDGIDRLLTDVLQANVARVTALHSAIAIRQNEDMRKISAWAAIALVPTAVAGIYGMNFEHMPELKWRAGYPLAIGVIVLICSLLYRTFRRNEWL